MSRLQRKLTGGYYAQFTFSQSQFLVNVTHPSKSVLLFSRLTNDIYPIPLKEIADNVVQLGELIKETSDDKLLISVNNELLIVMNIGKKVKEYVIPLEKAEMSNEQTLRKQVEELSKQKQQAQFEAAFYKEQYFFLLKHLTLQPDVEQLGKLYRKSIVPMFEQEKVKQSKMTKASLSSSMKKVGSKDVKNYKCPMNHQLYKQVLSQLSECNVCKKDIQVGKMALNCDECDFDVCQACLNIPPQDRNYCPNLHAVSFGTAELYQYRLCDVCKASLETEKGYSCVECDYDVCKDCV